MDHNDGRENGAVGDCYTRSLTSDELDLVERDCAAGDEEDRTADEAARDTYFAALRAELEGESAGQPPIRHPGLDPGSPSSPRARQVRQAPARGPG